LTKKIQYLLIGLFVTAVTTTLSLPGGAGAQAQSKLPEAVVAVIDINYILQESAPVKKAEDDVKALLKSKVDELNKRGDALLKEKEALDKQRAILAPDAYQQKLAELNQQRQGLQRDFQVINGKMNEVLVGVRLKFRELIIRIAADVSKEKGVNIGIDRERTVFFNPTMNITEEVMKRFNDADPKVDIKIEETPASAPKK
jgi:Skp family chaperone for outer membrane proteins|tara:strand:+ start:712 stop:1311 length:600 start_codon:yes stop_codon:yes gene_type:complete